MSDPAAEARRWLLSAATATLCTLAAEPDIEGWPFGSLVPYALAGDGTPIVLLSGIAQHTRNVRRDPRASLFVADPAPPEDAQAAWRVTVVGRARPLRDDEFDEAHARYVERVPEAPGYFGTHDFGYWAIDPVRVRAIGGFGAIHWLPGDAVLRDPRGGGMGEAARGIASHVNGHHEDALRRIVAAATGTMPASARIRSVDCTGFLVETKSPDALRHVGFGREIDASEARDVFVELTRAARGEMPA